MRLAETSSRVGTGASVTPSQLFGYEIIETLGQGAGSTIYAASHPQTRQLCAIKHVVAHNDKEHRFIEQLKSEYEVGSKVAHPGLRKSLDLKIKSSWLSKSAEAILVLELFDGVPLDRELPATLVEQLDCFVQTARALHALHHHGYVHCDLKPANILVGAGGVTKVIDLGQACAVGTKKPRIQGTPDFIAPEQVKCEPCTVRTDVFNFGATLYWCLSGEKLPTLFTACGKKENSFLLNDRIRTPHEIRPSVPENLSNVVMDCVRIRQEKRPADMAEVVNRLEVIQFGLTRGRHVAVAV